MIDVELRSSKLRIVSEFCVQQVRLWFEMLRLIRICLSSFVAPKRTQTTYIRSDDIILIGLCW